MTLLTMCVFLRILLLNPRMPITGQPLPHRYMRASRRLRSIKSHTLFFFGSCGAALPSRAHLPAYLSIPRCLVSTPYQRRRQTLATVIGEQHAITAVARTVLLYLKLFGLALHVSCVRDLLQFENSCPVGPFWL